MIPNTKVFVGSLPPGAKPQELRRLFENFGVVTECDIMNRCGFVHMENAEVAEKAIQGLNNSYFMGQAISVEPGRMKERRPPGGGRESDPNGGAPRGGSGGRGGGGYGRGGGGSDNYNNNGFHRGASSRTASNNIDLGGGSAMRRSTHGSSSVRSTPYQRYGTSSNGGPSSGGGYDRRPAASGGYYGGSPGQVPDSYGSPSGGSRYHSSGYSASSSSYGMGSQDRRGFALPDRHSDEYAGGNMYNDHLVGSSGAVGSRGSSGAYGAAPGGAYRSADEHSSYGQHRRSASSSYYANGSDQYSSPSMSHYQYDQGYSGSSIGTAPPVDAYNSRRAIPSAECSSGSSGSYGRSSYGSSSAFNQEYPPLGNSSRSYGSAGQPQRRDAMPNPRY